MMVFIFLWFSCIFVRQLWLSCIFFSIIIFHNDQVQYFISHDDQHYSYWFNLKTLKNPTQTFYGPFLSLYTE